MARYNKNGLTENMQVFCDEYLIDLNGTRAYSKAYPKANDNTCSSNAVKLLAKTKIKEYIKARMESKNNKRIADQDEVLEFLTATMRGDYKEQFALGEGQGFQSISEKELQPKDRIKAAELLGKRYGLYVDKTELSGNVGVTIVDDLEEGNE